MGVYSVRTELGGKKFGRLLVIEAIEKTKPLMWKCQCDCGNIKNISSTSLKRGESKSCGCWRKEYLAELHWKGYGEISSSYFSSLEHGAKKRNLEFNITIQEIWELFLRQNRKCALSNLEMSFRHKKGERADATASLDRIDSSKGYTSDNIQWIYKDLQFMKNDFSEDYFIEMCSAIHKTRGKN